MSMIVERMAARRRTILLGSLIGFSLWRGAALAQQLSPPDGPPIIIFVAVQLVGGLIWAIFLIRVLAFGSGLPVAVRNALSDELTTDRRRTSVEIGLFAVMSAQVLLLFVAFANPATANNGIRLAAEFTILVGTIATIGSYLYLDRE